MKTSPAELAEVTSSYGAEQGLLHGERRVTP
jgi:hypothetical protein